MGKWGLFLFSEQIAQLEAFKATLNDESEIAKVDATISLLKAKKIEKGE